MLPGTIMFIAEHLPLLQEFRNAASCKVEAHVAFRTEDNPVACL